MGILTNSDVNIITHAKAEELQAQLERIEKRSEQLDMNSPFGRAIRQKDILDLLKYDKLIKNTLAEKRRIEKLYGL